MQATGRRSGDGSDPDTNLLPKEKKSKIKNPKYSRMVVI
jgi:hypothetical protein